MKKNILLVAVAIGFLELTQQHGLSGHCQIPCGIYDDHAQVREIIQDVETIRKSVIKIAELSSKGDGQSNNQLARWVMNKESHAQKIISTICDYFLTQRVKTSQPDYAERLKDHHAVIVAAMKTKQNANLESVDRLKESVKKFASYYPKE